MESEVDVSLIEATLALTPRERLEQNDRVLQMIEELREGFAKADEAARRAGAEGRRARGRRVARGVARALRRGRGM
ncbi:MAG TPA: hypothetical protein VK932_27750 [Kofleriaceae bacterium]|nr:hypothetical protein [Kofleriaceae bacterium]